MGWFRRDKTQDYAQAMIKVSVNLLEVAISSTRSDHAPIVLSFERPDAQLRYLAFCLATTYYHATTAENLEVFNLALPRCWEHFAQMAAGPDGEILFNGPTDRARAIDDAAKMMIEMVQQWKVYANERIARHQAGIPIEKDIDSVRSICVMLRKVESTLAPTDDNFTRLTPLAIWIQQTTPSIEKSVAQLAR